MNIVKEFFQALDPLRPFQTQNKVSPIFHIAFLATRHRSSFDLRSSILTKYYRKVGFAQVLDPRSVRRGERWDAAHAGEEWQSVPGPRVIKRSVGLTTPPIRASCPNCERR